MSDLDLRTLLTRPFEVYYDRLAIKEYEFLVSKEPESLKDYTGIEIRMGTSYGLTFRCENKTGAELDCTISNDFIQVVPDWLSMVKEEDYRINSGEKFKVEIKGNVISFRAPEDDEEIEDDHCGSAFAFYSFDENQDAKYLILDIDGLAVKISPNGCAVDEDGDEIESELILDLENNEDLLSTLASRSFSEVTDMSRLSAVKLRKEKWINSVLLKFLNGRVLKLNPNSE